MSSRQARSILVDRTAERHRLARYLEESRSVLLSGEVGVGKSRLLEWAGERATNEGRRVERVLATPSSASVPFAAFSHLLPPPRIGLAPNEVLYDLIAHLRRMASQTGELVLLVDDVPWLDDMSAVATAQVVQLRMATVVSTARTGEQLPPAVANLVTRGHVDVLHIRAFAKDDMFRLAEALV